MNTQYIRDQRGVAMLLELVLVGLVLALVGVALYQSNHQKPTDAAAGLQPVKVSATTEAEATAKAIVNAADTDTELSAATTSTADEFTAVDADVTDLGGSFNESNF